MEEILQGSAASPAGTDGASSRSKPLAASRCSLCVLAGLVDKPLTWLSLELAVRSTACRAHATSATSGAPPKIPSSPRLTWEFPKIRGTLFRVPYSKDPTI